MKTTLKPQLENKIKFNLDIGNTYRYEKVAPTLDQIKINEYMHKAVDSIRDTEADYTEHEVELIEFKSRDGFIPHSYNHGGFTCHILKSLSELDDDQYIKTLNYHEEYVLENNPKLSGEDLIEAAYDSMSESNEDIGYLEAQFMFNGMDEETEIYSATLSLIVRSSDAPYFRYADSFEEFEFEFKNSIELKKKINEVLKKNKYDLI